MADGLTAELKEYLLDAVGPRYRDRIVSSEPLLVEYVSTRTPAEDAIQREASAATFAILRRALSDEVITPGRTTLLDVHYWITAEWKRQGFEFNFPASVDLQRAGADALDDSDDPVIQPGDLLHVDFGVRSSGIVADQQKMAYVLRPGEQEVPAGLRAAFERSNRMAEIILEELVPGRTGIAIKTAAEARARRRGDRRARLFARAGQLGPRRRCMDGLRLAGPLRRPPAVSAARRGVDLAGVLDHRAGA